MDLPFRPMLTLPPGFKPAGASRPYARFDMDHTRNLAELDRELKHLGAKSAHLQPWGGGHAFIVAERT